MSLLSRDSWLNAVAQHRRIVSRYTTPYRERRGGGGSHPVYDFLFTYYTYSTRKLEQWHPGFGVELEYDSSWGDYFNPALYELRNGYIRLRTIKRKQLEQALKVKELFEVIDSRPARFACFGLHEWAMVYRSEDVRHNAYPLRLSPEEIAEFCERQTICCSHFDAFRFFTEPAKPLNVLQPTDVSRLSFEQGGCLHVNMDLYKWAYKLSPMISSDLLRDSFMLAVRTREIDMRASPYDLESLGFSPIRVETEEGRREYVLLQREISEIGGALRQRFLAEFSPIVNDSMQALTLSQI